MTSFTPSGATDAPSAAARSPAAGSFAAGDDPAEYVETSYRISERKYAAWPVSLRDGFEAARTVKAGKPTFRLVVGEAR